VSRSRDTVPDAIEPLTGYRMWALALTGLDPGLHSLTCRGLGGCPWEGTGSSWVQASCHMDENPWHISPSEDCTCGLYAMPTLDRGLPWVGNGGVPTVMGRVELAGKVIEHEFGYRAEKARIAEFIPIEGAIRDVMRLGNRLGIPIAPALVPPSPEPLTEPDIQILRMVADGWTIGQIARSLVISRREADRHLKRIFQILRLTR
jgi:DNA-binding CsgD family transcriptional regulator